VHDRMQTSDAVLRNYPVVGHMRYVLTEMGEFSRQYFFAMDREELPFNRAERDWVSRSTKNQDNTVAFGSTRHLRAAGTSIFVNCPYSTLNEDAAQSQPLGIGPFTRQPYQARAIFNISGRSYGALSTPTVRALSRGAKIAGCWMNTGEGALLSHHLIILKVAVTLSFKAARQSMVCATLMVR